MTIMVIACFTIILDIACKVCRDQFFNITAAATDDLYSLSFKHILGALAHVACKHDHHPHLSKHRGNSAFTSASFRGSHLADICHLSVNDIKDCIVGAMTEMIIHASVSCWYRYLHTLIVYYFPP